METPTHSLLDSGNPQSGFLRLENLSKTYAGDVTAVADLCLDLPEGQMLGLLGPSGCGKSTTLRMIAGLIPISGGKILVGGQDVSRTPPHQRDFGLVFQNYALFPHMTVSENIAFGLEMRGTSKADAKDRIAEALAMVRMSGFENRKPKEMSGGQQQRVALARALVIRPSVLLLDEPLSNLDAKLRDDMRIEIREIQQRLKITTVFVTHDQVEALTMCDLVGVMHKGKLAQLGTPEEIYERPSELFVAEFVGRANILPARILSEKQVQIGDQTYSYQDRDLTAGEATVAIRPHRISLTPPRDRNLISMAKNCASGVVERLTYIGDILQYDVRINGGTLKIESPTASGGAAFPVGSAVMCEWNPADMMVFGG